MPTAYTTRPVLNFDAPEPAVSADPNASALFPTQPIYARTAKKKASNNLPLMVGLPVLAVAAGALIWGMSTNRAEAPTDPASMQTAVADTAAPATTPTELAVNETPAPAPVARSTAPRAAAPARPAARRAAPVTETAPDASTASSNVSATVPVAPPTVSAAPAPAVSEPAPLVIPPPAAPQPTPQPAPVDPM